MPVKKFTFFWCTGHRDVYEGETAFDAFKKAGYGNAALGAVDFWAEGDSQAWKWVDGAWVKTEVEVAT